MAISNKVMLAAIMVLLVIASILGYYLFSSTNGDQILPVSLPSIISQEAVLEVESRHPEFSAKVGDSALFRELAQDTSLFDPKGAGFPYKQDRVIRLVKVNILDREKYVQSEGLYLKGVETTDPYVVEGVVQIIYRPVFFLDDDVLVYDIGINRDAYLEQQATENELELLINSTVINSIYSFFGNSAELKQQEFETTISDLQHYSQTGELPIIISSLQ